METMVRKQTGAILPMSLIFLFIMTVLSLALVKMTALEEKMSHNVEQKEYSFQATESALREAETWLLNLSAPLNPISHCQSGPCILNFDPTINYANLVDSWWPMNATQYGSAASKGIHHTVTSSSAKLTLKNVSGLPYYRIEYYRFTPDSLAIGAGIPTGKYYYRATAESKGSDGKTESVIQTTIARRY